MERELKLYSIFTGVFVACLLLANVTSQKLFSLGPLVLPGGVVVFPLSFILNDILTETYGYARSRKIIWIGFGCQLLAALTYLLVGALPPASFWNDQTAYDKTLGFIPRIVIASIVAFICGGFSNSWVLSRMKHWSNGKRGLSQAWRFIASTIVGEAVDSFVVLTIAFAGVYETADLVKTGLSIYVFKVLYEILAAPLSVKFANWVKKIEKVDEIDDPKQVRYSPFAVFRRD